MPLQEFWNDNPDLLWAYRKSYVLKEELKQETISFQSWLQGYYNRIAIISVLDKNIKYLTKPINLNKSNKSEKEEKLEIAQRIKNNMKKSKEILEQQRSEDKA